MKKKDKTELWYALNLLGIYFIEMLKLYISFALGFPFFVKSVITRVPKKKRDKGNGRFADHWDLLVRVFVCPAYTAQCTVYTVKSRAVDQSTIQF